MPITKQTVSCAASAAMKGLVNASRKHHPWEGRGGEGRGGEGRGVTCP